MDLNKKIAFIEPGDEVQGFFILRSAAWKKSSNGKMYLNAVLSDASGEADAKMWEYQPGIEKEEGSVVKARVRADVYKESLQLTIEKIRPVKPEDAYSLNDLVPAAPIDSFAELEYIQNLVDTIEDADYKAICEKMLDRHIVNFAKIPAAKTIHHSFLSGLLMHTANMLRIADYLSRAVYPDAVDRSLLLAGTLLHDMAKDKEYSITNLGLVNDVTVPGVLLGHLVMGAQEICEVGRSLNIPEEKIMLLQHMVLSHHGQPEYGAAVKPCLAESELLYYIDLIDSRMEIYAENFEHMEIGKLSDRVYSLDNKKIYNHE